MRGLTAIGGRTSTLKQVQFMHGHSNNSGKRIRVPIAWHAGSPRVYNGSSFLALLLLHSEQVGSLRAKATDGAECYAMHATG